MGFGLKPFLILKFATMLEQSPNIGNGDITVRDDPRVLPVGRFLERKNQRIAAVMECVDR